MPITGKKLSMSDVAFRIETTRRAAVSLVERELRNSGSRMAAYEIVAQMVGVSSSWVRKFVGRNPNVKPDLIVGYNILALAGVTYDKLCTRVEQEAEKERARAAALRADIHAAFPGLMEFVEGEIQDVETAAAGEPPPQGG